jgi:hypothetical protein
MGPLGFLFALCWLIVFRCEGISIVSFTFYSFVNSGVVCVVVLHGLIECFIGLPLNFLFMLAIHMIGTRQHSKWSSLIFQCVIHFLFAAARVRILFTDGFSMVGMLRHLYHFWSLR